MNALEHKHALDVFLRLAAAQPELLVKTGHSPDSGRDLAEFVWAFIDEYQKLHAKNVSPSGSVTT